MNKTYKVIWNQAKQLWVVTGELSKANGKSKTQVNSNSTNTSRSRLVLKMVASLLAASLLPLNPLLAADALPTGANVVNGNVAINSSGQTMTINQSTNKAIVNWNTFSIGQDNTVNIVQPDVSSAILNRVTGAMTSTLAGQLNATGQVYLINPNGIAITSTGSVNVGGGFVASTLDMTDEDFLNNKLNFTGNGESASVSNKGIITVGHGGYAALMGGSVNNEGVIAVPLGKVGLGSGEQATLDLSGDGFLQVAIPTQSNNEDDTALIENSGTLSANGGMVVMKVATARYAARHAINMSGVVDATTVSGHQGKIIFGGGDGGTVTVSGTVNATADNGTGGSIEITGDAIELTNADINASGTEGGGNINIGGDWHGEGEMQTATTTTVDADTTIFADATKNGDGGEVVIWSNDLTTFAGTISAKGAGSGNGGYAEVSGKQTLSYTGFTDLSSENGHFGTLLLDPYNVTIADSADSTSTGFIAAGDDSVINVTTLTTALSSANVEVTTGSSGTQDGDINVAADIDWSANTLLTLTAANDININADITATGTSAGLKLTYGGDYSFATDKSITLSGASATLNINSQAYTLIHDMAALDNIDNVNLAGYYALAQSLDASGTTYTYALVGGEFTGTFTGLGHTISNLNINAGSTGLVGLFGSSSGTIRDIGLINGSVKGGTYVGGLVGWNTYNGNISHAYATGSVSGGGYVGGLVGWNHGSLNNAYTTGNVTGSGRYVGGLVGWSSSISSISHAYATGNVTGGQQYVGGLVGYNDGSISDAYATGSATGSSNYVGGLVGSNDSAGSISNTYATGAVSGDYYVGGLVGQNGSLSTGSNTISNAYATGAVSGDYYVGGLVGWNNSSISHAHATGAVTGASDYVGGLAGWNNGNINDAYATGNVTSSGGYVGGLAGWLYGSISDAYATGNVKGSSDYVGGLVGWNYNNYSTSNAYATGTVSGGGYVGGLVGYNRGIISNVYATGNTVTGTGNYVGGLVGSNEFDSSISNAYAIGAVSGGDYVGGLVGNNGGIGSLSNAYATGAVSGGDYVGGLVGRNFLTISNAYATGTVTGNNFVGGLAGQNGFSSQNSTISNAYATGNVISSRSFLGGLVGRLYGSINNAYATGNVKGKGGSSYVGGLVGWNSSSSSNTSYSSISNAYASGAVSGGGEVGGLVGYNGGSISNAYASGDVSGYFNVGGLVGYSSGRFDYGTISNNISTISNAYATGAVSGFYKVGGLVGENIDTITSSFWNTDNMATGIGSGPSSGATGLTTAQFQDTAGFMTLASGWNFNTIWAPPSDGYYPELYALSPVVWVKNASVTSTYGDGTGTVTAVTSVGGTSSYLWGAGNDSLTLKYKVGDTTSTDGTTNAGTHLNSESYTLATENKTVSSDEGIAYRIFYYDDGTSTETVTARDITITANDTSRIYGHANPTFTYDDSELVNGDTLTGALSSDAILTSGVGDYDITIGTLDAGSNYNVTVAGTLSVTARDITITADDTSRIYGNANPTFTYDDSELINGDTLTGALSSDAILTSGVGDYDITIGTLDAGSNYNVTVAGTLSVTARDITITADDTSRIYGDANPTFSYSVDGGSLANNDTLSLVTTAGTTSDIGDYAITLGTNSNYDVSYTAGTLTVTTRAVSITANDQSRAYGDANTLSYTVNSGSLVNGDTLNLTTTANTTSDVGTYAINLGSNLNYNVNYTSGNLNITTRAITVTANDLMRIYGIADPALSYTVGGAGLVNNDTLNGNLFTAAGSTSNVGSYSITQGTLSVPANYAMSFTPGTLTVIRPVPDVLGSTLVQNAPITQDAQTLQKANAATESAQNQNNQITQAQHYVCVIHRGCSI